ncbi:MAG: hypothetical protein QXX38_02225 [Candidatus Aenigmatarchaeota archaeon]
MINKIQFTIFFILAFLLLSSVSFATGEITVTVSKKDVTLYSGGSETIDITIENNQNFVDRVSVTVFPQYWSGITATLQQYVVNINPKSKSTIKLFFDASVCVEEVSTTFSITAKSTINENVKYSTTINLNTVRNFTVCIDEYKLSNYVISPNETLKIITKLKNPTGVYSMPITLETKIMRGSQVIQKFEDRIETVPAKSSHQVIHEYTFGKYATAEFYAVEILLKDSSGNVFESKKINFRVSQLPEKVVKEETVEWGFYLQTVTIKVRNEGNVNSSGFYLTATIPSFMKPFFFPKIEPTIQEKIGNTFVYSWYIEELAPGEEREIKYEINTWNALIVILIIICVILYSFKHVFKVSVIKKHKYTEPVTKEKEILISLEVRNRTRHGIKDVLIRDFVPSIATVVERFDTLKPTLRKVAGGTEIIWRLNYLGPLEERIITYRVKPTVDIIGTLKLPKALMRYTDKEKRIKRIISKNIKIKGR